MPFDAMIRYIIVYFITEKAMLNRFDAAVPRSRGWKWVSEFINQLINDISVCRPAPAFARVC